MSKEVQLTAVVGTLAPKSIFTYGGVNWIVLQNTGGGILCLAEKILFKKAFDEGESNNWEDSTLREHLNNEFLEELVLNGAEEAAFLPMVLNLVADDGLDDYGTCEDLIGLINCQQYRQYRRIIPNADGWWWTITPYSTKANGYSYVVRYVSSDGSLNYDIAFYGSYGVRPLCTLKSSILVSVIHKEGDYQPMPESEDTEEVAEEKEATTAAEPKREATDLQKQVNNKFCECIIKAQERYLKCGGELSEITNAVQLLNAFKDGLPL